MGRSNENRRCKLEEEMIGEYKVYFFTKGQDDPAVYKIDEIIDGMRKSVTALKGASKKFVNKVIRTRNDDNAIVFYEQIIEKEGQEISRLFTIESWKWLEEKWVLFREVVEPVS
jgi:hypothetical protein